MQQKSSAERKPRKPAALRRPLVSWYSKDQIKRALAQATNIPSGTITETMPGLSGYRQVTMSRTAMAAKQIERIADAWYAETRRTSRPTDFATEKKLRSVRDSVKRLAESVTVKEGGEPCLETRNNMARELQRRLGHAAENLGNELGPYPKAEPFEFGLDEEGQPIMDFGGEKQLHADIDALHRICRWTDYALAQLATAGPVKSEAGRKEDRAKQELISSLATVWVRVLVQRFGTSTSPLGQEGGPMIRFIQACAEPLGLHLTGADIRSRLRNVREIQK